jgi:hypothetical protein
MTCLSNKKEIVIKKKDFIFKGYCLKNGKYINKNIIVIGTWKNNVLNGKCEIFFYKYYFKGNFKDGKPHGYGKMIINNIIYKGYFKSGNIEGKGKLYNIYDKFLCEGKFHENKMINKDIVINHPFADIGKYINY